MGFVKTKVHVSSTVDESLSDEIELLADTGALYSVVPGELLKKLKVVPRSKKTFVLANGGRIERQIGDAVFRINGEKAASPVVFGEAEDKPLLGVVTLESLGLQVDPVSRKLVPADLLLLSFGF